MPTLVDPLALAELHRLALEELQAQDRAIDQRAAAAQATLRECEVAKDRTAQQRASLKAAAEIYGRVLAAKAPQPTANGADHADEPESGERQRRARIGPQRYLILHAIRTHGAVTVDRLAELTRLNPKRIRDQIRADLETGDMALGTMSLGDQHTYVITDMAKDLLQRWEAYKRSRNEPLPTPESVAAEEQQVEEFVQQTN